MKNASEVSEPDVWDIKCPDNNLASPSFASQTPSVGKSWVMAHLMHDDIVTA